MNINLTKGGQYIKMNKETYTLELLRGYIKRKKYISKKWVITLIDDMIDRLEEEENGIM